MSNLAVAVSGSTISFSARIAANCDAVFAAFDPSHEDFTAGRPGIDTGDDVEFELTLSKLPDTTAMLDAKDQDISFTGTVTVSHIGGPGADADADTTNDNTVDTTKSYNFSGMAKYETPNIEPAGN